jgi:hypothetical protein
VSVKGAIQEIRFYFRAAVEGQYIRIGVGQNSWNEKTIEVSTDVVDTFFPVRWNLRNEGLTAFNYFGVETTQALAGVIWIDRLEIIVKGHKTYNMRFKRASYSFNQNSSGAKIEFGSLPSRLTDYVAGLQATATELKFVTEVR